MPKKMDVDENLPFNKYMKNHPELSLDDIASMTGIPHARIYNLRRGTNATLLTACLVEYFSKGELKCSDLLPLQKVKEFEIIKEKCAPRCA